MKNKGITLVALIITIIILLILATVSISLIINSGIIDKAQHGVDRYSEEEELEQIKLAVASARLKGNGFLDTKNLNSELRDKFGANKEATESSNGWIFKLDKNYIIYENGNVEEKESILPAEYQQVEYIESSGTQYIDTGIFLYENYGIDLEAIIQYTNQTSFIGASQTTTNNNSPSLSIVSFYWDAKNYLAQELRGTWDNDWGNYIYEKHKFGIREGYKIYVDDNLIREYSVRNNLKISNTATIFWVKGSRFKSKGKMKLYSASFYNNENEKINNFIPCYSTTTVTDVNGKQCSSGTIGLYDTVEGKFYTNQGTGTFGYGMEDGTYVAPTNN